jgi:hypothetical protein
MALVAAQNGQEIVTQILILDPLEGSRVRGKNDGYALRNIEERIKHSGENRFVINIRGAMES